MYVVLEDSYHRYRQLSSTNQQLYRELILANATGNLVRQLNNASDISDDSICDSAQRWVYFYVHIEIFDRRGGDPGPAGILEAFNKLKDIQCSREFATFVNERNACKCLGGAYDELKRTTPKTNKCAYCQEEKPRKQISVCSGCRATDYCSRECQVADYPKHKVFCKKIQERLKEEMSTAEFVD